MRRARRDGESVISRLSALTARALFFACRHKKYLQGKDEKWVDLSHPDMQRYPDFNRAAPVEFVLEAGEMLYIPRKWPHAAVALEPSLSLSANFLAKCNKVLIKHGTRVHCFF